MKAIDFACRFLSRLQRDELSPAARLVLVAVAAGLEDKNDISHETRLSHSVCTPSCATWSSWASYAA